MWCIGCEYQSKANTLESFIEVDKTLNKLKIDDLIQDLIDGGDGYLIP